MTLDQFYRAVGGTAAETAPRLGGADATRRFLRLFPLDDSFPQLSEALGRGDAQTAFRAAHTLKGVAANLGLSGSMSGTAEDHIEVGDLIFTKQADIDELKVGDVVAFMDGSIVVTHRIVSISADRTEFVTKGDANNTEDEPISADQIIGQYSGRIPKVGDFALFLQKPLGMVIFIGVPVCAFVVWDILRRRRETRAGDEEKEQLRRELERLKAEKPAE